MSRIQDSFNSQSGDFRMEPGEYEGPLTITRPCVVDGGMSTLWANSSPVLIIQSAGVTVKNLRVEVTGETDVSRIAIQTSSPDTVLSGVEVSGGVLGVPGEEPEWNIPALLPLGTFAAGQPNSFSFRLNAPAEAELSCSLRDIKLTPKRLVPGENLLYLETSGMKDSTILYGEILVTTMVTRRIYITGKAKLDAPQHKAEPPLSGEPPVSQPMTVKPPQELIAPQEPEAAVPSAVRGQRMPVQDKTLKAVLVHRGTARPLDIDGYAFLLQENGKVRGDSDFVFFGNQTSEDGSVYAGTGTGGPLVAVDLEKAEPWVSRIVIAFSIYGEDMSENFSLIQSPSVRLLAGERDFCRFPLAELSLEKTVVALEVYRYKGAWKIHFVGAGYHSELRKLCESYGVEVE